MTTPYNCKHKEIATRFYVDGEIAWHCGRCQQEFIPKPEGKCECECKGTKCVLGICRPEDDKPGRTIHPALLEPKDDEKEFRLAIMDYLSEIFHRNPGLDSAKLVIMAQDIRKRFV